MKKQQPRRRKRYLKFPKYQVQVKFVLKSEYQLNEATNQGVPLNVYQITYLHVVINEIYRITQTYVAWTLQNEVAPVSDPPKIYYFQRIQLAPDNIFGVSEQHSWKVLLRSLAHFCIPSICGLQQRRIMALSRHLDIKILIFEKR